MGQDLLSEQLFGQPRNFSFGAETQRLRLEELLEEHQDKLQAMLGREFQWQEVLDLAGVPNGARVRSLMGTWHQGLWVHVDANLNQRGIVHLERRLHIGQQKMVDNIKFIASPSGQRQGLGARMLAHQVTKAASLGFDRIAVTAVRGDDFSGYLVWPRLGFEGLLGRAKPAVAAAFLETLGVGLPDEIQTVQDLLDVEGGDRVWEQAGTTLSLEFDLAIGSRSWEALKNYLELRQIGLAESW